MTSDGKHIFRVIGHCFRFFTFSALSTYTRPFTPTFHTYARKKRKNGKMKKTIFFSTVIAGRIQLGNNHHVNTYDNMLFFVFSFFRFIYIIAKKRKNGKHKRVG